jgi:hypothetical protein
MSESTYELPGGTIRIAPDAPEPGILSTPHEDSRVYTGVAREDGSGQLARDHGSHTIQPHAGIMSTCRNSWGGTRIDSTSTVDVGGMRTSLRVAMDMGLIREVAPGRYEDVMAGARASFPEEQAASTDSAELSNGPELAPQDEEAAFGKVIEPLAQPTYDAAIALASEAVLDTTSDSWVRLAEKVSSMENIGYDQAAEQVEQAHQFFTIQVDRVGQGMGFHGGELESAYDFMRQRHPDLLRDATQQLVYQRKLDGFRRLFTMAKARGAK